MGLSLLRKSPAHPAAALERWCRPGKRLRSIRHAVKYTLPSPLSASTTVVGVPKIKVNRMTMKAQSHSLRRGRYSEIGRIYLVTSRLHPTRRDLKDWRVGRLLVKEIKGAQDDGWAHSLAWVVMPDHFHWLMQLRHGSLAGVVQRVKSKTAIAVNRATGKQGPLWQCGYHDVAARHEDDLIHFARYIVANPLRAGLANRIGDYPLWDANWLPGAGVEFGALESRSCRMLPTSSNDLPEPCP